jgi:hypothetical protein
MSDQHGKRFTLLDVFFEWNRRGKSAGKAPAPIKALQVRALLTNLLVTVFLKRRMKIKMKMQRITGFFLTYLKNSMLTSYLLLWYRRMLRRKAFAAINVAGLSISLSGALLIYLYVSHELSFDRFHEKADRIFRVYCAYAKLGESVRKFPYTPLVLSPTAWV